MGCLLRTDVKKGPLHWQYVGLEIKYSNVTDLLPPFLMIIQPLVYTTKNWSRSTSTGTTQNKYKYKTQDYEKTFLEAEDETFFH